MPNALKSSASSAYFSALMIVSISAGEERWHEILLLRGSCRRARGEPGSLNARSRMRHQARLDKSANAVELGISIAPALKLQRRRRLVAGAPRCASRGPSRYRRSSSRSVLKRVRDIFAKSIEAAARRQAAMPKNKRRSGARIAAGAGVPY